MMGEEYQVVSIVIAECVIDILMFLSLVFYHLNYANVFYYHIKTILLDDLGDLL